MADDDLQIESLRVATIESMPFAENTYVARLADRTDCVVVDPGMQPELIVEYIREAGLTPTAILITHGHGDHIAGIPSMKHVWPTCPVVIGRDEASKLTDAWGNLSAQFGMPITCPPADVLVDDGERYMAAGMEFEVASIPGHSSGHIVFIWRGATAVVVFGGDVLFRGSIGRTDFPDGSLPQLSQGIRDKLYTLPDEAIVLSGHGPPTTTGREKRSNPYVKGGG